MQAYLHFSIERASIKKMKEKEDSKTKKALSYWEDYVAT
jgi:hypothetical protein